MRYSHSVAVHARPLLFVAVGAVVATASPGVGARLVANQPTTESVSSANRAIRSPLEQAVLAFQGRRDGDYEIYVARADGRGQRQLTRNGVSDRLPDWSPDGRRLLFVRSTPRGVGSYFVMTAEGRRAWRLGRAIAPHEWSPDARRIAFVERGRPGLGVVNADGRERKRIHPNEPLGFDWSRDGTRLVFGCGSDICVADASGRSGRLVRRGVYPDWSPDGRRIAFLRRIGDLYGVHVMRADGSAVKRLFPVKVSRYTQWSWSPDGRRLAIEDSYDDGDGDFDDVLRLGVVNADGSRFRWIYEQEGGLVLDISWSPDGRNIAFDCGSLLRGDICVADTASNSVRNLTETEARGEFGVAWSPDGKVIAFVAHGPDPRVDDENTGIFVVDAAGGEPLRLTKHRGEISWSPDGRWIAFRTGSTRPTLYVVSADGRKLTRIARPALRETWKPQQRR